MICPVCGKDCVSFAAVWMKSPYFTVACPACRARVRATKPGIWRYSSYLLGIPPGILGGLGVSRLLLSGLGITGVNIFWSLPVFLASLAGMFGLDVFIDRRMTRLKAEKTEI